MVAIKTTIILTAVTCLICAGALTLQRTAGPLGLARRFWIGGFGALGVGWMLHGLRETADLAWMLGTANVVLLTAHAALVPGFDVVAGRPARWWIPPLVAALGVSVIVTLRLVGGPDNSTGSIPLAAAASIPLSTLILERVSRQVPSRYARAGAAAGVLAAVWIVVGMLHVGVLTSTQYTLEMSNTRPLMLVPWTGYLFVSMGFGFVCLRLLTLGESALLEQRATQDGLTGVASRSLVFELLAQTISESQRYRKPTSIILFDLDNFKTVNDTFGHAVGDLFLTRLADAVRKTVRQPDIVGRLGGDEFVVLCAETQQSGAYELAERIRTTALSVGESTHPTSTISLGVAEYQNGDTSESLLKRADDALYRAKAFGGNQTHSGVVSLVRGVGRS